MRSDNLQLPCVQPPTSSVDLVDKGYNIHRAKDANDDYVYNGIDNTILLTMTMTMTKAAISTAPKLQMSQQEND